MGADSVWLWTVPKDGAASARADVAVHEAIRSGQGRWEGGSLPDGTDLSRSRVQALIKEGRITMAGAALKAGDRLRPGAEIRASIPAPRPMTILPEDLPIAVLYEDAELLIVNKPPGLTVHPTEHQTGDTLVNRLLHHVKGLSGIGGVERPGIVHRIDKDTSGALVITKTDRAHHGLSRIFARHEIDREYWALVYGAPSWKGEKRIEGTIGRNPADRKRMAAGVPGGRMAITHAAVEARYGSPGGRAAPFAAWVRARLETGRTHQVRVHLTSEGHSLLGDPAYGHPTDRAAKWLALPEEVRERVLSLPGQALHARVLGFLHPVTGARVRVEAPEPDAFRLLREALKRYALP
ncbi:MAG: RluA family pseudouridine synthase [Bdellovibrionales bacterium]|nr:RluA family pseudouridine synthase [Bdellovibrionales bacterium]